MNSVVRPIFNEKVAEKWNLWVYEQCTNALFTVEKSTLWLLINEQCMNSSCITPETRGKKKRKRKRTKREAANAVAALAQSKQALSQLLGINSWD